MNFLRHPFYSALALGASAMLSMSNARGLSFVHSANPLNWAAFRGASALNGGSHGSSHFSHK